MNIRTTMLQLRKELKMRQVDLAAELGISTITLNRWETEKNKPSRAMSLAIISFAATHNVSKVCQAALKEALLPTENTPKIDDLKLAGVDQINNLVNDSFNAVMVSDAETHDILYANRQLSVYAGKSIDMASKNKCYEFIFGKDHPCDFCQVDHFSEREFHTGEYESQTTGRFYVARGKIIDWGGKKAHIEYITDMTDFHKVCKELHHHRELMTSACENAQLWVFTLELQTENIYLEPITQKLLGLPPIIPNFIDKMISSNSLLASYEEECYRTIALLKNGKETVETVVQTKILSSETHWVRFRAKTVEYDSSGKPYLAACSAQMIDNEVALQTFIRFEHEQIIDSRKDLMGYIVSNITKNIVLEGKKIFDCGPDTPIRIPYETAVEASVAEIEPEEDKKLFAEIHDRNNLLRQFAEGELEQDIDYQLKQPDGKLIWVHNKMKLMPQPNHGDVILYEYCFSTHSAKIMEGLLTSSMDNGYDLLGAVSLLNDQVARLKFTPDGICREDALEFSSYTKETEAYCRRCVVPEERDGFLKAMSLDTLFRELKDKRVYRVSYKELTPDGTAHTKIAQYTVYDQKRLFCILSILDLDKFTASVNSIDVSNTEGSI